MRISEDVLYQLISESIRKTLSESIEAANIDAAWLEKKYYEFNQEYFGGILGPCYFGMFTTGSGSRGKTLGHFLMNAKNLKYNRNSRRLFVVRPDGTKLLIDKENFFEECHPTIELNANYRWTEEGAEETLIHEMCHYYTYMYGFVPRQGHGSDFKSIAATVSARSNGKFSVQRLATAEEMAHVELDPEIKSKNDQQKQKALDNAVVAIVYTEDGDIRLVLAANVGVINNIIKGRYKNRILMVVASGDADLKSLLVSNGYRKLSRSYTYWSIKDKPIYNKIEDFEFATVYDYHPIESSNTVSESLDELELYHGSPKQDSFDKFDIAYLSSGWGQQAYGYGFYLTNSIDAAKQYGGGGYMYKVEVPDGKYLSYNSISMREKQYIAKTFFKYYTTEDDYGKQAYPDEESRRDFWNEECRYLLNCDDGGDMYGTIASLIGSDEQTSQFLHGLGYKGIKFPGDNGETGEKFMNYVIFDPDDIKILEKTKL